MASTSTSLNDYNISYQLNCLTKNPERMPRLYSELHLSDRAAMSRLTSGSRMFDQVRRTCETLAGLPSYK